ncbi:MAG: Tim44/TimA family putative adaptor protein [Janthinobacterium lividum]
MPYVVFLLMLAIFAGLRLYAVLGKRTGHEQQPLPKAADATAVLPLVPRRADAVPEAREPVTRPIEAAAEPGLRAIVAVEPGFDVGQFVGGAQSAYRMVLEAFWKGDVDQLAWLVEPDVQSAFAAAIAARDTAGHRLDNRLVSIERVLIVDAALSGRDARVTVRFDADIAAVTRDDEGNVIAGSITDAVETHDLWTFARTLKSNDPNWKLADTDEA